MRPETIGWQPYQTWRTAKLPICATPRSAGWRPSATPVFGERIERVWGCETTPVLLSRVVAPARMVSFTVPKGTPYVRKARKRAILFRQAHASLPRGLRVPVRAPLLRVRPAARPGAGEARCAGEDARHRRALLVAA